MHLMQQTNNQKAATHRNKKHSTNETVKMNTCMAAEQYEPKKAPSSAVIAL
jgi:hypothetical protein